MYDAADDPYCYPGTSVLKNRLDLRDQAELEEFEAQITAQRADEPLTLGALTVDAYRTLHRHLFQDVYDWAGEFRTVRIAKGGNWFCYPEYVEREMHQLFSRLAADNELKNLDAAMFAAAAAKFLSGLNAIHPFREGNGRTQNILLSIVADRAGHPLQFGRLDPPAMLDAMVAAFQGDEELLTKLILGLM